MSLPVCYPCPYQTKNKNASHGAQYYLQRILCKVKKPLRLVKTYVVLELNFKLHNERLMKKKNPRLETVNNIIEMRV